MRIIEIIVGSDSEPSEAVSFVCCDLDPVEDDFLVELVLDILVSWPLDKTETKELSMALKVEFYNKL